MSCFHFRQKAVLITKGIHFVPGGRWGETKMKKIMQPLFSVDGGCFKSLSWEVNGEVRKGNLSLWAHAGGSFRMPRAKCRMHCHSLFIAILLQPTELPCKVGLDPPAAAAGRYSQSHGSVRLVGAQQSNGGGEDAASRGLKRVRV